MDKSLIEQSAEDMSDIRTLQKCSAYGRYFLRRLDEKIERKKYQILYSKTHEEGELEGLRHELWALEEARQMPDQDMRSLQAQVEAAENEEL